MLVEKSEKSTVRYGALGIAYKEFAGDLGPNSLAQIRNRGGRSGGPRFLRRRNFGLELSLGLYTLDLRSHA